MGSGLSFWIFLFSLFPNPIVEDGKLGFVDSKGECFITPAYFPILMKDPLTIENFIGINKETVTKNDIFPKSTGGKVGYISQDSDSLIILGKNGQLFDSFSLNEDTVQMYYYLDRENSTPIRIEYLVELQTAIELYNSDNKTIKIGLKDNKGNVIKSDLDEVKGLKEYFRFNNTRNKVKVLGDNLIFADEKIIDFKGNLIMKANSVEFSENQQYIICSNQDRQTVINLDGEVIMHSKLETIGPLGHRTFGLGKTANHPNLLMNSDKDTLLRDYQGVSNLQSYYGLGEKYEFNNFDIEPTFTVKMSEKEGGHYAFINNDEEWIHLPKIQDSLYPIPLQNPQSDYCIVKYVTKKFNEVNEGIVNKKGEFVYNPKRDVTISPVSGQWVHIHERNNDSLTYFLNIVNGNKIIETNIDKSYNERSSSEKSYFNIEWKSYKLIEVSNEKYILDYDSFSRPHNYKNIDIYRLTNGRMNHVDSKSSMFIPDDSNPEVFIVEEEGKYYLYNLRKSKIVSEGFDNLSVGSLSTFNEESQLFIATKNDKKGMIDVKGNWIIKPIYLEMLPFRGKLALVQMDSTSFEYINRKGETVWKLPETDKTAWNKKTFLESFKNCEPSIYMEKQGFKTMYKYEIKQDIGKGKGCRVQSSFILNANLDWMGKTMTCTYDNSLPFQQAIQPCLPNSEENSCDCEGELWEVMSDKK